MQIKEPSSHLDHLMRQARMTQVQLSQMADMKASMLLTMASVVITLLLRYITDPALRWPVVVLMLFCLVTIVLAAYAVMPKTPLSLKRARRPDTSSPTFSLLFFGHFALLELDEFESAMEEVMNDHNRVYQIQVREVYSNGVYLAREKYRFIRLAYISFIVGLFATGIAAIFSGALS